MAEDEDVAANVTRYFEREPHGMTPPGFKRAADPLRAKSTFVCEACADGLSASEIDEHATYPDNQFGGEDRETGGWLCKGCDANQG